MSKAKRPLACLGALGKFGRGCLYSLSDGLHLLFDGHAPDAESTAQEWRAVLLQQAAVILQDAVGLPGQLPLQVQGQWLAPEGGPICALPSRPTYLTEGQIMSP